MLKTITLQFQKLLTELIFAIVAVLTLISIALTMNLGLAFIWTVVLSFGLNVWALTKSEKDGFLKSKGMPRAGDPQRQLHPVHNGILVILMVAQVVLISYQILTSDPSALSADVDTSTLRPSRH